MEAAYLTALSAVAGAAIGATASLGTTWLTQRYQDRSQRLAQERARRERLFGEFIDQASQLYADALSHTALEDPARLVPLYATIGKLRLLASERTIAAADAVMVRIVETYYLPNVDFTSRPSPPAGDSDMLRDFDLLRDFTEACRAELGGDTNTSLKEATCSLHETSHTHPMRCITTVRETTPWSYGSRGAGSSRTGSPRRPSSSSTSRSPHGCGGSSSTRMT